MPTAYIPTTTNPVSRAADGVSFTLTQALKNTLSVEQPAPSAALTQAAGSIALSTVAGTAFVMPNQSSVDLSPYAGGGYVLKVTDSAGKVAWARMGAAGTGETLGSELITNGTFDSDLSGWTTETGTVGTISWEAGAMKMEQGTLSEYLRAAQDVAVTQGALVKAGVTSGGTAYQSFNLGVLGNSTAFYGSGSVAGTTWVVYFNKSVSDDVVFKMQHAASAYSIAKWDNAILKQVLAPNEQGVWLESTPGAADQAWSHLDSGFDPNSISTWAVYPASQWHAEGTLVLRGWVPGYSPSDYSNYQGLVSVANAHGSLLYVGTPGTTTYLIVSFDGVNAANVVFTWVAGVSYDLAVRWSSATNRMQVGYKLSSSSTWTWGGLQTFDGAYILGATVNLGYSPARPFKMGRVEAHDSWLADPLEKSLFPWEHPDYSQVLEVTSPHLACFLDQTYRYWRLELTDPDNSEGYLRASLFYLGGCFAPQRNFRAGYGRGTVATRTLLTSSGGKLTGSSGALAAYFQLEFARLEQADAQGFEEMLAAVHAGGQGGLRPMFFTPFTDDPGQTLYCLPGEELSRREAPGGRWDLGLRLEEVVKSDV